MAWTAPMTAVAGNAFTAAQFNTYVRDNLLETAPAKATTAGGIFVATGANAIRERVFSQATVTTSQTTTSTSYTDLTTPGPAVTVTTGSQALVFISAAISTNTESTSAFASIDVSGGTTLGASNQWCIQLDGVAASNTVRYGITQLFTGLTANTSHTFTMKYKVGSNTGTFGDRHIAVLPL